MGTPHTSRNQGKILKFHGIERVKQASMCNITHKTITVKQEIIFNHKGLVLTAIEEPINKQLQILKLSNSPVDTSTH